MSRISLRIPDSLHQKLKLQANQEGISLHQYLIYLLAQRSMPSYSVRPSTTEEVQKQEADFAHLFHSLGTASHKEIQKALQEREPAEPESGLTPELLERLQRRLTG